MTKRNKILLIFFIFAEVAFAQSQDSVAVSYNYDTTYIRDFRHFLNLAFVTEIKDNTVNIFSSDNKIVNFFTNQPQPNYGVMGSYKWLNFSISYPIPFASYANPDKGDTKSFSAGLGLTGRKLYLRGFYERFKGYYLSNPQSLFPQSPADTIILFPDMTTRTFTGTAYFGLNGDHYSHRVTLHQSEKQLKSAGSVIFGLTAGYKDIVSENFMVLTADNEEVNAIQYYSIGASVGYGYTYVFGKYFNLSGLLIPGASFMSGRFYVENPSESEFKDGWGITGEARLQLYYARGNYYAGLGYTGYLLTTFVTERTPLGSTHNYFKLNFGYRFRMRPMKFLKPFGLSN